MIFHIDSKNNKNVIFAFKLKDKKYQNKYKKFLSEGFYNFELALKAGVVESIFTLSKIENIDPKIDQFIVNESIIEKLSSYKTPQPIIFICKMKTVPFKNKNRLIYLDNIQDPGNLGTILRTAYAFNYDGLILSKNCCSVYNEKVISSSKGAIFCFPIIIDELKNYKDSHFIVASSLENKSIDISTSRFKNPFIICLGNESNGISEETKELADEFVIIPISNINSLNVGVASGILLYEFKDN